MVKTLFVGNGAGSANMQTSVRINGQQMPIEMAVTLLLGLDISVRPTALTMHDGKKMRQATKGRIVIIDGAFSAISFIGTQEELDLQVRVAAKPTWDRSSYYVPEKTNLRNSMLANAPEATAV